MAAGHTADLPDRSGVHPTPSILESVSRPPASCHSRGWDQVSTFQPLQRIIEMPHPAHSGAGQLEGPPGRFPSALQGLISSSLPSPPPPPTPPPPPPRHCRCGLKGPARPLSNGHLPTPAAEPPAVSTKAGSGSGCPRPGRETSRSVPLAPQGPTQPLSSTLHWSLVGRPGLAQC